MAPSRTGCQIHRTKDKVRVEVGPALPDEVQQCYRALANECVTGACLRVLVVGNAAVDAFSHLALRDALRVMALAGVPGGFRLALVAVTANLIAIYDTAVVEAERLGIEARRFMTAEEAERWLA